jgi:hypothetical protein
VNAPALPQLDLFPSAERWRKVTRCDRRARLLADRHYSRQTPGAIDFTPPGETLVLLTDDWLATWAVVLNLDPAGGLRWRCTIFRNEGAGLSSALIREATERTYAYWLRRWHVLPPVPLTTEVNPARVRRKRDPGRCFLRAGWKRTGEARGLVCFEAPPLASSERAA